MLIGQNPQVIYYLNLPSAQLISKNRATMNMNKKQVGAFETLQAQLTGLYEEMQTLVKKSPNDSINKFKLSLVNGVLRNANAFLGKGQQPVEGFVDFAEDDL